MTNGRLWVGPLLLILIIAVIYIFSLIPQTHSRFQDFEPPPGLHSYLHDDRKILETLNEADLSPECYHRGSFNSTDQPCICLPLYTGRRCEIPVCLNGGRIHPMGKRCECDQQFVGTHCDIQCGGGLPNKTTDKCDCFGRFFGRGCDLVCLNGEIIDGECKCFEGYIGLSCTTCDPTYRGDSTLVCGPPEKKRGAVNSRLTLSGLSFCMITIGLLCVTARRRRLSTGVPPSDDTWYRVFQPQLNGAPGRRCRHDFMCGGAWVPRDRALLVGPARTTARVTRVTAERTVTPPPSYCSVENVNTAEAPPTYEEAVHRVDIPDIESVEEETDVKEEEFKEHTEETPLTPHHV